MMKKGLALLLFLFACKISFSQGITQTNMGTNSLLNMYSISVTIGGDFIVNGTFPASSSERVDQFITRMYEETINQLSKSSTANVPSQTEGAQIKLENFSLRNIILKRISGETIHVDLLKFRVTGDFNYNPYMKNEDVIIFAPADFGNNFFTMLGAVNRPGKFLFSEGDKLSDALILTQGINKAYENVNKVEIDRLSYDGKRMDSLIVNINEDVTLQRGDRITVLANENERKDFTVNVIGEVNRPGVIPISKDNETIKQVIDKCGGFKDDADLYKAELVRGANAFKSLSFSNELEQLRMLRMSTLVEEDTTYFNIDNMIRLQRGNGLINFNKLVEGDTAAGNFKVRDGDVIYIPQQISLVYIFGQVNNPGYVKYKDGEKIDYYMAQAEGLGETASGDIYLIKGKSRAWFNLKEKEVNVPIEAGDYIWVSKKTPRTFWYNVGKATQLASVITGFATILLIYLQLRKM